MAHRANARHGLVLLLASSIFSTASTFTPASVGRVGQCKVSSQSSIVRSSLRRVAQLRDASQPAPGEIRIEGPAPEERQRLKDELMRAIQGLDRGFNANTEQRKVVDAIARKLAAVSPTPSPAKKLLAADSAWTLLYSDAPDIVGSGQQIPFAPRSGRIGQRFDAAAKTVTNLVESVPPSAVADQVAQLARDSVQQEVVLKADAASDTRVSLSLLGTSIRPERLLGLDTAWLPPLQLNLPAPAPFGAFEILYYDGDLRVVRTGQGYLGINTRDASP